MLSIHMIRFFQLPSNFDNHLAQQSCLANLFEISGNHTCIKGFSLNARRGYSRVYATKIGDQVIVAGTLPGAPETTIDLAWNKAYSWLAFSLSIDRSSQRGPSTNMQVSCQERCSSLILLNKTTRRRSPQYSSFGYYC